MNVSLPHFLVELAPLDPLAREIYRQLVRHLRSGKTSITYGALAELVSKRIAVHPRSPRLHAALGEVTRACRDHGLPALPAIVWRADREHPADGYFNVAYPRMRSFKARLAAWEREHARVLAKEDWPESL